MVKKVQRYCGTPLGSTKQTMLVTELMSLSRAEKETECLKEPASVLTASDKDPILGPETFLRI